LQAEGLNLLTPHQLTADRAIFRNLWAINPKFTPLNRQFICLNTGTLVALEPKAELFENLNHFLLL
jgi:hypothetical protein